LLLIVPLLLLLLLLWIVEGRRGCYHGGRVGLARVGHSRLALSTPEKAAPVRKEDKLTAARLKGSRQVRRSRKHHRRHDHACRVPKLSDPRTRVEMPTVARYSAMGFPWAGSFLFLVFGYATTEIVLTERRDCRS
jgi:hypothetical protein